MPAKVTPRRLADKLDAGEDFLLLDTRGDDSYESWHVRGAEQFEFGTDDSLTAGRRPLAVFPRFRAVHIASSQPLP